MSSDLSAKAFEVDSLSDRGLGGSAVSRLTSDSCFGSVNSLFDGIRLLLGWFSGSGLHWRFTLPQFNHLVRLYAIGRIGDVDHAQAGKAQIRESVRDNMLRSGLRAAFGESCAPDLIEVKGADAIKQEVWARKGNRCEVARWTSLELHGRLA